MEFKIHPPIMFLLFPHNKLYVAKKMIKKWRKQKVYIYPMEKKYLTPPLIQPFILNSSRENYISPKALLTDELTEGLTDIQTM